MGQWHNRVVLIAGGSSGLGQALAQELAEQGARVVIVARDPRRLTACTDELSRRGLRVTGIAADVTSQPDVDRLFDEVESTHQQLHVLANCAGRSMRGKIEETTVEEHTALWNLNFLGTVRMTLAAIPMLRKASGSIVNIGSLAGRVASPFLGAYPCSKFPVTAFSQQLRLEIGPQIHVLLVLPGPLARTDAGARYAEQSADLPPAASQPGGGARLKLIEPSHLARQIRRACERRRAELVVPARARILFALAAIAPQWADRIIRNMTDA